MNRKISIGIFWNILNVIMSRGAGTLFMLFLARLLAPEIFGLIAMAVIVFELANAFIDSGFSAALIQSKSISEIDLNTVFYTNIFFSITVYFIIYISAPLISDFYDQIELVLIIQVMGLVIFFNAAKIIQIAVLSREMDFKTQMKANTFSVFISGLLAVAAAFNGWGVWSLVVQMMSASLISSIVLWFSSSWRPRLQFSTKSFIRLFGFGKNLLAERILAILYQNSYVLVIGRFFSAEMTGLYYFAKKISNLISQQLTNAVQQATFPALATLQDNNDLLKYKYRQIMQLMMFLIAPVMALLVALSPFLFDILFDEQWSSAVNYLQILCVVGTLYPMHALNINLLNVKGRSDLVFKVGLFKKVVNITLLILAIPYGIFGILLSQVIASILSLIPNTYFSYKLIGYSLFQQIFDVLKPILSAILAGLSASFFVIQVDVPLFIGISGAGLIGIWVYLIISYLIRSEGAMLVLQKFSSKNSRIKGFK